MYFQMKTLWLHLIGRVLNHSHPSTTAIYAHFGHDSVRDALELHGRKTMRVAGKETEAKVLEFAGEPSEEHKNEARSERKAS